MTDQEFKVYNNSLFSKVAPWYWILDLLVVRVRSRFSNFIGVQKGDRILDVATGTGRQAESMVRSGADCIAVDLSPDMLHYAEKRNQSGRINFIHADASCLPFEDSSFDIAVISFAFNSMTLPVRKRVVREMVRVTRNHGKIGIVDWRKPEKGIGKAIVRMHSLYNTRLYREYTRSDFSGLLDLEGLSKRESRTFFFGAMNMISCPVTKSALFHSDQQKHKPG